MSPCRVDRATVHFIVVVSPLLLYGSFPALYYRFICSPLEARPLRFSLIGRHGLPTVVIAASGSIRPPLELPFTRVLANLCPALASFAQRDAIVRSDTRLVRIFPEHSNAEPALRRGRASDSFRATLHRRFCTTGASILSSSSATEIVV